MQTGTLVGVELTATSKETPGTRLVIRKVRPGLVSQLTPSTPPRLLSSCTKIWLFAVTAVVEIRMELAPTLKATEPAAALPHCPQTLAQLLAVL